MLDSEIDVEVELDADDWEFRSDEPVTGTVKLRADDDVEYDAIHVRPVWAAEGRAPTDSAVAPGVDFPGGQLKAGETHHEDFEIGPTPGPYTYHGHYVNILWKVRAEVDVSWASDPADSVGFDLVPGNRKKFAPGESSPKDVLTTHSSDDVTISYQEMGFGLIFMLAGLGSIALFTAQGGGFSPCVAVVSAAFTAVGAYMVYDAVKNAFAEMQLGDVDLNVDSHVVTPGDELEWEVEFQPSSDVQLNYIDMEFNGREWVKVQEGTDTVEYTEPVHTATEQIDEAVDATLPAGETVRYRGTFQVPETDAYSFKVDRQQINWELDVYIDVEGWSDWEHTEDILLRPSGGRMPDPREPADEKGAPDEEIDEAAAEW